MVKLNKKNRYLKKARACRKQSKTETMSKREKAKEFIVALFLTGLPVSTAITFSLLTRNNPPSRYLLFETQKEVIETIENMAREVVDQNMKEIEPNTVVSFDGSWSKRRNAPFCIVDAITTKTKKIIDYEIVSKSLRGEKGNFDGPSNQMEAFGFQKIMKRMKNNPRITAIVKDGDVKISNLINKEKWSVRQLSDPNHKINTFYSLFSKYNKMSKGLLRGLRERLFFHLEWCLRAEETTENKIKYWYAAAKHFQGDHSSCFNKSHKGYVWPNAKNKVALDALNQLLSKSVSIITDCEIEHTTNPNEYYHAVKAHMVPKIFPFRSAWSGRICASILQFNAPYLWVYEVRRRLSLPHLPPQIFKIYNSFVESRLKQKLHKSDPDVKSKQLQIKKSKRIKDNKDNKIKSPLSHK